MRRITPRRSVRETPIASTASSPELVRSGPSHVSPVIVKAAANFQAMKRGAIANALPLIRRVGIKAHPDHVVAAGGEDVPGGHHLVAGANDRKDARQIRQHE